MVDLPDALSPVNQMVKPRCLRYVLRSLRDSDGCQVILLFVGYILVPLNCGFVLGLGGLKCSNLAGHEG
jgi:hypothetical protein